MQLIAVLFNGLEFSHHLAESAIAKAKSDSANLLALFLAGQEKEEGYIFPSDLDEAQDMTDKEDAERSDVRVIRSQMKLIEDMARAEGLTCSTELMVDPSLEEVLNKINSASLVMIDAHENDEGVDTITSFQMKDLFDRLEAPVQKVSR
jgi:hypothetical protein